MNNLICIFLGSLSVKKKKNKTVKKTWFEITGLHMEVVAKVTLEKTSLIILYLSL